MKQYWQGDGEMIPVYGALPTTRTDGTPYAHGQEDFFRYYVTNDEALITDESRFGELVAASPPIGVKLVDGVFSQKYSADDGEPGRWFITLSTVDVVIKVVDGEEIRKENEGPINREQYKVFEILVPLAPPNPPTGIA